MVLELVCLLDLGMSPAEALAQPRIHHQWSPNELMIEKTLPSRVQAGLARRGHKLKKMPPMGVSQIVARSPDGKGLWAPPTLGRAAMQRGGEQDGRDGLE